MSTYAERLDRIERRKAACRAVYAFMAVRFPRTRVYVLTVLQVTL